jgi:hypothetical protein
MIILDVHNDRSMTENDRMIAKNNCAMSALLLKRSFRD